MQSWVVSNPLSRSSAYLTLSALTSSASWWRRGCQLRLLPRQGCQLRLLLRRGRQFCLLPCQGRQLRQLPRQGCQLRLLPCRGRQLCLLPRQLRRSKNILISCPKFRSRHVSGRVRNTKACVVIVEYWGFFLAPHSISNLTGGLLLKSIIIRGLLLDAIIFGGLFVTLVTWFNDFYLSQLSLKDLLDHSSPCKQEDLYFGLSIVGDFGFLSTRRRLWSLSFYLGDNFTLDYSLVGELSFLSTRR